ncbi:MAG TPA: chromosome segregation protein SMC [Erysipelotrichaceae bacterium]|nr:chromosome segregation protein SMC [Erysipelotrichaceae bacterium]
MFLKRIEMQGFKSFADRTVISFEHPITGVVGPNGCGKSNIADAVRWVLGEQSAKSMRGEKMNDVIFAGSADRRKLNMAEVTLVFDNTTHILNDERDELEVTRRLYRDSGDAEYLINRVNVRLKDVVELFLDTGLGRDSLSIISQGNVVSFAEAKPQERRGIFEEAAGVAKYKKRKIESLSRLERTTANLERSQDVLNELEKQVSPLKRQARKAEIYREKKARLEEIEISVLVQEIEQFNADIESAKKTLFEIETQTTMYNTNIMVSETRISESRKAARELDRQINDLQDELMRNYSDVQALEARKTELDERRKYIVNTGSDEQKIHELRDLLDSAKVEYDDRKRRLDSLNNEIRLLSERLNISAQEIVDRRSEYEQASGRKRSLENRKSVLEQLIRNPFNNQAGIRSVMDNRQALSGILGVVGQVLNVENGYEEAISTALGGAMNNIVTRDEQAARDAIRFLNRNMSGRATFLPLNVCSPRYVSRENQIICQNTKGYLGTASDFVTCDPKFDPIVQNLLQNVLVCDTMESGNNLSALTKRMYKIVTLDGEVIHRGGSMTGGKTKHDTNIVTMRHELQTISEQLDAQSARTEIARRNQETAEKNKDSLSMQLQEKRFAAAALEPVVEAKQAKYEKLQNDYSLLQPQDTPEDTDTHVDELVLRLNSAYSHRDEITNEIKTKREQRLQVTQDADRKEAQLKQMRKELQTAEASANAIKIDQSRIETKLENDLQRLASEYQLTYEYARTKAGDTAVENAREEVATLRAEIERLGNINMNAPEEYNEVNERYETMKQQIDELTQSRDKILAAIDEMDTVMKKQFKEMFDQINAAFNDIFRNLYGGGKATLILQDPTDILNTGIDIDAQPPGKAVQNNMLFSGGEKSLIALCVLFAILKVKPVPLVILDEVEAALDPANVERFADHLHRYTDRTQFIVVTHRTGTMQNTDVLYGVTMQHQGVSQMLKVELSEAMTMADPSAAEVQS